MDCNKAEAIRAKELAERKLIERSYASAKEIALKAQKLYPRLEGLSHLLTTIDVYISGENKTLGEADWYGILGVVPYAKYEIIREQYRKLAFMLHPDKNKSPGAEGAFKLVSEAWSLLSDKAKREAYERLTYHHSRNLKGVRRGVPTHSGGLSEQPTGNAFQNVTNSATSHARAQHGPTHSYGTPTTFWTICNLCSTYYQFLRIYLNQTLMCPTCQKGFSAIEKAPPPCVLESFSSSSRQEHRTTRHHGAGSKSFNSGRNKAVARNLGNKGSLAPNSLNKTTFQQDLFSKMTNRGTVQQANEKVKREREEIQSITEWERSQKLMGNPSFKKKRTDDTYPNVCKGYMANKISIGNDEVDLGGVSESGTGNVGTKRIYGFSSIDNMPNSKRELSYREMQNMLMEKARTDISKMLKEQSSATESKNENKEREKLKVATKQKSVVHAETKKNSDKDNDARLSMSINVPDPDFHNFDLDRAESSFREEQVWAAYDGDGMPRYYARIQKVISRKPFKVCISWLNSRSNTEFGTLDWIGSGFAKTCGDFRPGKRQTSKTLNSFSNKVSWKKVAHGMVRVFPGKMEVWALYMNWSPNWNQHTPDEVINKYDMVEVLDDFTEEHGVSVVPLIKVAGFRTVFQKHMDPKAVRRIPKEEMFRFSHIVPSHLLTGGEAHNAPKGCLELDPVATPLELLEVTTEAYQAPMAENVAKTKEEVFQNASTREVDAGMEEERFQNAEDKPMVVGDGAYLVGQGN